MTSNRSFLHFLLATAFVCFALCTATAPEQDVVPEQAPVPASGEKTTRASVLVPDELPSPTAARTPAPSLVSAAFAATTPVPVVDVELASAPEGPSCETESGFLLSGFSTPLGATGGSVAPTTTTVATKDATITATSTIVATTNEASFPALVPTTTSQTAAPSTTVAVATTSEMATTSETSISEPSTTSPTTTTNDTTSPTGIAESSTSTHEDNSEGDGGKDVLASANGLVAAVAGWNDSGSVSDLSSLSSGSSIEDQFKETAEGMEEVEPSEDAETILSAEPSSAADVLSLIPKSPGRPPVDPVDGEVSGSTAWSSPELEEWNPQSSEDKRLPEIDIDPTPSTETSIQEEDEVQGTPEAALHSNQKEDFNEVGTELTQDAVVDETVPFDEAFESTHDSVAVENAGQSQANTSEASEVLDSITDSLSSIFDETVMASEEPTEVVVPVPVQDEDPVEGGDVLEGQGPIGTDTPSLDAIFDSFNFTLDVRGDAEIPKGSVEAELSESTSEYPEATEEYPESSEEAEIEPSASPEELLIELFVNFPTDFSADVLAEDIRDISNEFIAPEDWTIEHISPLSEFSKFSAQRVVLRQSKTESGKATFEMALAALCQSDAGCTEDMDNYRKFVRDESMDRALAVHDFGHVNVYVKGDKIFERADAANSAAGAGLGVGVIAGIAVGGVALVSLLVLGTVFMVKRNGGNDESYDAEGGYEDDDNYGDTHSGPTQMPEEQGSFLISNFGGSFRNASGMIPWMNESQGRRSSGPGELSSNSFISIDTAASGELQNNNMSEYRFEETTSSSSGSEMGDLEVDDSTSYTDGSANGTGVSSGQQ